MVPASKPAKASCEQSDEECENGVANNTHEAQEVGKKEKELDQVDTAAHFDIFSLRFLPSQAPLVSGPLASKNIRKSN